MGTRFTRKDVRITLDSRSGEHHTVIEAAGELFLGSSYLYVRYPEQPEDMGRTTTTIRLESDRIRVIRHGDVESEQTFVKGTKQKSVYQTFQGSMELEYDTTDLKIDMNEDSGCGTAFWSYQLLVMGEPAGEFELRLTVKEL